MKSTINFYLRDKNKATETPITLFVRYQARTIKISTGLKIHPKYWNEKKQVAKSTYEHCMSVNEKLRAAKVAIQKVCIENDKCTNAQLKDLFTIEYEGEEKQDVDFFKCYKQFMERGAKVHTTGTIKSYQTVYNRLRDYATERNIELTFECIDIEFYEDLRDYLFNRENRLNNNSFGMTIKTLKTFLNDTLERGLHNNTDFRKKGFKAIKEDVDNIYLSEKELEKLYRFDLCEIPHLERARDLFLVGCYTGLRFSDFSNIKPENIKGDYISIKTQKTKTDIVVPIHPIVREIMTKYADTYANALPPALKNQVMNRYLKDIGQRTGFDESVIVHKTKAGKSYSTHRPKYELITTHTARRSFATNAYLADIPTIAIMKITGHKTEKSFLKYIKVTPEENAKKLINHPFFKRGMLKAV